MKIDNSYNSNRIKAFFLLSTNILLLSRYLIWIVLIGKRYNLNNNLVNIFSYLQIIIIICSFILLVRIFIKALKDPGSMLAVRELFQTFKKEYIIYYTITVFILTTLFDHYIKTYPVILFAIFILTLIVLYDAYKFEDNFLIAYTIIALVYTNSLEYYINIYPILLLLPFILTIIVFYNLFFTKKIEVNIRH